jgi:hypothetical protein
MPATVEDRVLDLGLEVLNDEPTHIRVCSSEPTTYAQATTTHSLGMKSFGAGGVFNDPAAGTPNGRKVTSNAITDGTIQTTGTASWWAITDETPGSVRLLAHGLLASAQVVTSGNTFTLAAFDIRIPNQ